MLWGLTKILTHFRYITSYFMTHPNDLLYFCVSRTIALMDRYKRKTLPHRLVDNNKHMSHHLSKVLLYFYSYIKYFNTI